MKKKPSLNEQRWRKQIKRALKENTAETALDFVKLTDDIKGTITGAPDVIEWLNTVPEWNFVLKKLVGLAKLTHQRATELKRAGKLKKRELPNKPDLKLNKQLQKSIEKNKGKPSVGED